MFLPFLRFFRPYLRTLFLQFQEIPNCPFSSVPGDPKFLSKMMSPCSAPNQEEIVPAEPKASANQGISPHPLQQIAESANHKLLLKQWLKEEESIDRRVALKESRLDRTRKEVTQLCCFYFIFHGTVLTLLFNAAARNPKDSCKRAWIPSIVSLVASMVIIWAVRYKIDVETQIERLLKREKDDAKLMAKCIQELKRKGTSFDLLKEVDTLRRAKSLRVEPKAVMKWSGRDLVTIFFIAMSCLVLAFTKVVLCD